MTRRRKQPEARGAAHENRGQRRAAIARRKLPAEKAERQGWWAAKWPILKPVLIFAGVMFAYYAIDFVVPLMGSHAFDHYLAWIAGASAGILRLLGQDASAAGPAIMSPEFSVRIVRGCDALEPTAAFVAAVLASPVVFRRKVPGLLIGIPTLLVINLFRVVSLFFIGIHFPSIFETMHYEIWQAAFIVLAVAFWAMWVQWATRRSRLEAVGAAGVNQ